MGQFIDLTGRIFGKLTVLYRINNPRSKIIKWKCKCECGKEVDVQGGHLRSGHTVSCGCKKHVPKESVCDLIDMTFGNWTVIDRADNYKDGSAMWLCKCICGNQRKIIGYRLKNGYTQSCGCVGKEVVRKANTKHGMYNSRLYRIWGGMKERCTNPKSGAYRNYGAKGITICDEWNTFVPFMQWSLNNGYEDDLSIDRIDNSKGYSPDNCRWADTIVQANNKSTNVLVTRDDETHTIAEWCRIKGLDYHIVSSRRRYGWNDEELFQLPMKPRQRYKKSSLLNDCKRYIKEKP